jgi:ubiquitin carboxyl-terminal hydrolase 8
MSLSTFINLGNTCYANSVFQLLFNTPLFREYILENDYVLLLKEKLENNPSKFANTLIYDIHRVLKSYWLKINLIRMISLKNKIGIKNDMFKGCQQHDSHEFLSWILDSIHEELKVKEDVLVPWKITKFGNNNLINLKAVNMWKKYNQNNSIISKLFTGLFHCTLKCELCNFISHSFEPFTVLTLDVPSYDCKIEKCLENFITDEHLDSSNMVICNFCKRKNRSIKKMTLFYTPKILIIQLKRFKKNIFNQTCEKNKNFVSYPLVNLNLNNYFSENKKEDYIYQLFGVNIHKDHGLNSGHYFSYVKNQLDNKWYELNDERCNEVKEIQNKDAYLLFYYRNN